MDANCAEKGKAMSRIDPNNPQEVITYWTYPIALVWCWEARLITESEFMLLGKLKSYDDPKENCYAANKTLSKWWGKTETWVALSLKKFKKLGLITVLRRDGYRRILCNFDGRVLPERTLRKLGRPVTTVTPPPVTVVTRSIEKGVGGRFMRPPLASFGTEPKPSKARRLALSFANFSVNKRLHLGQRGSTTLGWTPKTIELWVRSFEKLLEQFTPKEVKEVWIWYQVHFEDPYIPQARTGRSFCEKFAAIYQAKRRQAKQTADGEGEPDNSAPMDQAPTRMQLRNIKLQKQRGEIPADLPQEDFLALGSERA